MVIGFKYFEAITYIHVHIVDVYFDTLCGGLYYMTLISSVY